LVASNHIKLRQKVTENNAFIECEGYHYS
jgi:hypothetical protein